MANSLLAHLYSRIKGSQEDVATISLQYLLSQSMALNKAFTKQIAECLAVTLDESLQYQCQATGENQERPDMAGFDQMGQEIVLCEMKFYAGLTSNQPLTYLMRLNKEQGKGLLFVCPQRRLTSLWAELKKLCAAREVEKVHDRCVRVDGVHMAIMTWAEVVELLKNADSAAGKKYAADIYQLEGYCAQMDMDAFIPFATEDLTIETAKKAEQYYTVVDETVERLRADADAATIGNATTNRNGYSRKLKIDELKIDFAYDRTMWSRNDTLATPFWVAVHDDDWDQPDKFQKVMSGISDVKKDTVTWGLTYLALSAPTDATLDEVCEDLKCQILSYVKLFSD